MSKIQSLIVSLILLIMASIACDESVPTRQSLDQAEEAEGQDGRSEAVNCLLAVPCLRVITVGLDSGDLWVYRQERVEEASVEDLVAALYN